MEELMQEGAEGETPQVDQQHQEGVAAEALEQMDCSLKELFPLGAAPHPLEVMEVMVQEAGEQESCSSILLIV